LGYRVCRADFGDGVGVLAFFAWRVVWVGAEADLSD
jgi:hypothetical protein